jgi:ribosomal protein L3 glutamine methyltransferase
LSYSFPDAKVDAVDISKKALEVAKINVELHGLESKVSLYQGDLFGPLTNKKYDLIVSNPPYVDAQDMDNLPPEIKHEPRIGLVAGDDGLELVDKIIQDAKHHLNPNGVLVVEVGNSQAALINKYPQLEFTWLDFEYGGNGVFLLKYEQL